MNIRRLWLPTVTVAALGTCVALVATPTNVWTGAAAMRTAIHQMLSIALPNGTAAEIRQDQTKAPKSPEGFVALTVARIEAQRIETRPLKSGSVLRHLKVPGTVTTDADRVARVPAKVVGTVAQMRKRLGEDVKGGEIVKHERWQGRGAL